MVDATTMLKVAAFNQQFLSAPATIKPGRIEDSTGVANGVINNKFYIGTTSTAPFAPDYGKYGNPAPGNYIMSPYFTQTYSYTFGYDTTKTAFISFSISCTAPIEFRLKREGCNNPPKSKAGLTKP